MNLLEEKEEEIQCWRFVDWLNTYDLNSKTIFDYFRHSPFYSYNCNNEALITNHITDMSQLKTLQGIEYEIDYSFSPDSFIITKQWRKSPTKADVMSIYFILVGHNPLIRGTVYKMPKLSKLLTSNLLSTVYNINEALNNLSKLKDSRLLDDKPEPYIIDSNPYYYNNIIENFLKDIDEK